ncbi:MAG: DUF3467 domain-containing protein [Proteobacteria bacterium]|nr:DUF3467 domain-containing protein [Pseudomonadota bacterium]
MATTPKASENTAGSAASSDAKAPRVKWDDSNMRSSYANVVNATSSREEVTLFFGTNQTWNSNDDEFTVQLTERIILNPFAAKRLILLLGSVLKEYESRYGALDIESHKIQKK